MSRALSLSEMLSGFLNISQPKASRKLFIAGLIAAVVVVATYAVFEYLDIPVGVSVEISGIPVGVSLLSLIMVIMFWVDGDHYIRTHQTNLSHYHYALASTVVMSTVVLSIALHELAHGITSELLGNPIDHAGISWWGAFVAPSSGLHEMSPFEQIAIALAGPTLHAFIVVIGTILVTLRHESLLENSIQYITVINIKLWRLNMIPLIFLDGGKAADGVLRLFTQDSGKRMVLMVLVWILTLHVYKRWRNNHVSLEDKLAKM